MIKSAILIVYTENSFELYEDLDQILPYTIAKLKFIDRIKLELEQISSKSGIIKAIIQHDVHAIMEKIHSLCDENDIKLIFIIGYNLPYISCKLSEDDIAKIIEKVVDKENVERYTSFIAIIKAKLESKYHRVIWGMRKKTLIINLFELYEEEAFTVCNKIVTTASNHLSLTQQHLMTDDMNNTVKAELILEKRQNVAELANISTLKINQNLNHLINKLTNAFKRFKESSSSSDRLTEKMIYEHEIFYCLEKLYSLCESNLKETDVANEDTISKEFSSPVETIAKTDANESTIEKGFSSSFDTMTKSNLSHQAAIDDKKSLSLPEIMDDLKSLAKADEESYLSNTALEKLNVAHHVTIDYKESFSSFNAMTKELKDLANVVTDEESYSSDTESEESFSLNQSAIDDEESVSSSEIRNKSKDLKKDVIDKEPLLSDAESEKSHISSRATIDYVNPSFEPRKKFKGLKKDIIDKESILSHTESEKSNILNRATIDDNKSFSSSEIRNELEDLKKDVIDKESPLSDTESEVELKDFVFNMSFPMIDLTKALSIMRKIIKFNINERQYDLVNVNDAYGRVVCQSIYSHCNVPAFRVSTKHGFAVLASDSQGIRVISKENTPVFLEPGTCVWVKSGARIPDGATAVVPIKDTKYIMDNNYIVKNLINIRFEPKYGQNIKDIGSDIRKNKLLISAFTRIGSSELGLLAATGRKQILVATRVTVGILSVGDLLEEPNDSLRAGYVYDSNRISIIGLLKDTGFDSILDCGIVNDNKLLIMMKIEEVLKKIDVLVIIGCTSDKDRLKIILTDYFNATIHFGNVNIKPGKSTTFGTLQFDNKIKYFLCLPKNPASTLITAHLFLVPLLKGLHHMWVETPCTIPVYINERFILHSRPRFSWAILKWNEEENFARAYSKENLVKDKPYSSQSTNALIMLPQKTDYKVEYPLFVNALAINIPNC